MTLPADAPRDMYRGDTYRETVTIREGIPNGSGGYDPGDPLDLTGCTPKAQIRTEFGAAAVLAEYAATIPDQTVLANRGQVRLELTSAQTAGLPDSARWGLQLTHPDGSERTYLSGRVTMTGQVTTP